MEKKIIKYIDVIKYIDELIQDFDKIDDIEKDRIKEIIVECYRMSQKTPRELLVTGLYTVEEIEELFPEKLKEDFYTLFHMELEYIYSDMYTLINKYDAFMEVVINHKNFFDIFSLKVAEQKLSKLQVFRQKLDTCVYGYINKEETLFTLLTNLKDIRSSFRQEDTKDMSKFYSSDPSDFKIRNATYSKQIGGFRLFDNDQCLCGMPRIPKQIEEYIPSSEDILNIDSASQLCETILQIFNACIDYHLSLYFRNLQILHQTMRRDFLRYIGKRLFMHKTTHVSR